MTSCHLLLGLTLQQMTAENVPCVRRNAVSGEHDPACQGHLFIHNWLYTGANDDASQLLHQDLHHPRPSP